MNHNSMVISCVQLSMCRSCLPAKAEVRAHMAGHSQCSREQDPAGNVAGCIYQAEIPEILQEKLTKKHFWTPGCMQHYAILQPSFFSQCQQPCSSGPVPPGSENSTVRPTILSYKAL